eukprot:7330664-Ditylum_brightwellii.AAC.1
MVTFSNPITRDNPQGNGPQELKPIIPFERAEPQEMVKREYCMYRLYMVPYNANSLTYDLVALYFDMGIVKEWLKFWQNLEAVITKQSITNTQDMCAVIKNLLCGDALTAFKNAEEINGSQIKHSYKEAMRNRHKHMFPLHAYITQT